VVAEIPLGIVAVEVVFCQCGSTVSSGIQHHLGVHALLARYLLRHDTEGTVDKLLDAPELLRSTRELRNRCYLTLVGSGQCAVCTLNLDLVVRTAEVTACLWNSSNSPSLMRTEHIVANADVDVSCGPCADHLTQWLIGDRLDLLVGILTSPPSTACGRSQQPAPVHSRDALTRSHRYPP